MSGCIELLVEGGVFGWNPKRGIPRVYREILPRLQRQSPDIRTTIGCQGNVNWWPPDAAGIQRRGVPGVSPARRPWRFWSIVGPAMNRHLAAAFYWRTHADVYHSTTYEIPTVRKPSFALVHDMMPERFPEWFAGRAWRRLSALKRRTIENADLVVCVSRNTREDVVDILGVDQGKCVVSHNGGFMPQQPDGEDRRPDGLPARPFVLYVGGHRVGYKNFSMLVRGLGASPSRTHRDLDLVVVTPESPTPADLARYGRWMDEQRLTFLTNCTDAHLVHLYRRCKVFVMPSLYEGFGIPVVEALSCGAPVACSNRASLPEVGGNVVAYFDPEHKDSLVNAIDVALAEGRSPRAVEARRAQAAGFTWEQSADRFAAVVRRTCRNR